MAYEELNYQIVEKNKIYEIRKYSDRLVVETATSNENSGFRKLFNYISGNNEKNEEIIDLSKKEKNIILLTFLFQFLVFVIIQVFEINYSCFYL